ncbi:MAG: amino acid adenylation domain-containing protein [Ferruginibacter sp.]
MTKTASAYQRTLNIDKGEIMRVVWMQTPVAESANRLLIAIHHLAVDGVSWRILLDDLELLLNGIKNEDKTGLGPKGSSYRQWYNALENYGQSRRLLNQLNYWQHAVKNYNPFPVDKNYMGPVRVKDFAWHNVRLGAEQTSRLLQEVPRVYHTEINDLLLAALAYTIAEWSGNNAVTIGLEGHGREDINARTDINRTVGWFTTLYPLLLTVEPHKGEADLIKSVKEQMRQLPDKGLGYGVLKYINKEATLQGTNDSWDIMFNYFGQLDNVIKKNKWLSVAGESQGQASGDENIVAEKIMVNSSVRAGELMLSWSYSSKHYNEETIIKISNAYLSILEKLIAHCMWQQKKAGTVFTPSDYGLGSEIGYDELDRFLAQQYNGKPRKNSLDGLYRLSGLQEGMMFHGLYDEGIDGYIEQFTCDMTGVNEDMLNRSWAHLMRRHSVLRSAFYVNAFKVPVQCVYKEVIIPLTVLDYRGLDDEEQAAAIQEFDDADLKQGFDFETAPLLRLALFRLADDKYRMLFTSHHLLFDGWSFPILMEEFLGTYELYSKGGKPVVGDEDRYEDYIRYIERADREQEEKYWRNYLQDVEHNTLLPFIGSTLERNKGMGTYEKLDIQLNDSVTQRMNRFAQRHRLTLNTIMQGIWAYLLHHYTGNKNIVYGIVVSGRPDDLSGVEQRVGMYINTLPLHSSLKEDQPIVEWLQGLQMEQVNSRQYQHTPFAIVQNLSGVQGDLFDTLLTFENYPFSDVISTKQWALNVSNVHMHYRTNYPLSIVVGTAEQIIIRFSYNERLLDEVYVKEISGHFENVLLQILENGDSRLGDINLLTVTEQQQLLVGFNGAVTGVENEQTILDLFSAQAIKSPHALAIVFNEQTLTYEQLDARSNQLAHYLKSKGVKEETQVPICIERSLEMMIAVFGILKAGGAYVPIDPGYPQERINYMLEDTGASIVLSNSASTVQLLSGQVEMIELDTDYEVISQFPSGKLNAKISSNQLAYIIYTSGSTGRPKGVMIEHGSLSNYLLNNKTNYISIDGNNAGSYLHLSYTFDASLTAMFMPLVFGKSVIIGSKQSVDIFEDVNLLKYAPYDFIKITPAHLELLQPQFKKFTNGLLTEKLVIGGEALRPAHFDSFIEEGINVEVINEYGPTEATVGCAVYSFHTITDKDKIKESVSIGKPISNAVIYILDDSGHLVPVGVKGHICIGGAGVARGYLNRHELSEEKFVPDPFSNQPGSRMYKTGDVGRWLPDGNIEYLGRMDDQVKIRGYRVELGEIEHVLEQCEVVAQGVVLGKEEKEGGKRLVSYYVPASSSVKSKELELHYQRVASWKELYETEYGQTEGDENVDPEFNIIGWNDSFTGEAMPAADMKEWLDDIVQVVLSQGPQNVLEIGCGTGLIYYQLAGKVNKYIGSDLSTSSINQIRHRIGKQLRDYGDTELFTAPAHQVTLQKGQQVDTILLNSMVQYFPGEDYMNSVIRKCMELINGKGRIIIGDVRDNRLLELFKGRLRIQKLQDSISVKEFKWGLQQDIIKEEELCFSPAYFYGLKKLYPQITNIEIQWKQGSYINELSLYRYTVVISVGIQKEILLPEWKSWSDIGDKQTIFSKNKGQNVLAFKDVPNLRLWKESQLQKSLQNNSLKTVGEIRHSLEIENKETIELKQLLQMAALKGYSHKLFIHEDPLMINLLFENKPSDVFILPPSNDEKYNGYELTNIPLFTDIAFLLQKDIREFMQHSLPDYMVPSEFTALRQLPLTGNGKVDRLFLGLQEDRVFVNTLNYLPPATDLEKSLAEIWKELLHLERVGIEDDFFELGGHSLLAMRVISAIRKQLDVELNIKELFINSTIGLLAAHIDKMEKGLLLPSIEKQPRPEHIPLSFSQERLWFIDQLDGSLQYHMPTVLRLKGELNIAALSNGLQQIINRHEILRTIILSKDGNGYQHIREIDDWHLSVTDSSVYAHDIEGLHHYINQLIEEPFNLSKDYMLRATLITLSDREHILAATLHHIASDGWSASIMVAELVELYNAMIEGRDASLKALPVQFADYAIWQRRYLQGNEWEKKLDYWTGKLADVEPLQLPTDHPRPLVQSTKGAITGLKLDKKLLGQLQVLSNQQGTTLFMTLLAAFNVLLYRYSGQEDICVGTPIAGRQQQELEGLIGFFVNTLVLRNKFTGNTSFEDLLQQIKSATLDAYDHQEVPFEKVVELVVKERDMTRSPLFQVMLALQNTPEIQDLRLGDLQLSLTDSGASGHSTTKFELTFNFTETAQGLHMAAEYCTDLFNEETIKRMMAHYSELLKSIIINPAKSIGDLTMLTRVEQHQLIFEFNDTFVDYPKNKTIVDMFEEQVAAKPNNIALLFGDEKVTYKELNERSNQLAHYLISMGVKPEMLIPICIHRGVDMIVAILGILKAGGAYVPIDIDYPEERIAYMLEDTAASMVLTNKKSSIKLPTQSGFEIVGLDNISFDKAPCDNLKATVLPNQLAYVIYTSGSTGKPKGVMIEHSGVVNLAFSQSEYLKIAEGTKVLQFSSSAFDASCYEIFNTLLTGGILVLCKKEDLITADSFEKLVNRHGVEIVVIPPSFQYEVKNSLGTITTIVSAGEPMNELTARHIQAQGIQVINAYGPTESTVCASITDNPILKNNKIVIGKPIDNIQLYVVSDNKQLVPIGVTGELCISGVGIARGYLNRHDLTSEKFINNLFNDSFSRMYTTGDLVRLLPDGNIEYLGRKDDQVKIRGYRIELGEIENVIVQSEMLTQVVVVARPDSTGDKQLVGYAVTNNSFDKHLLISYLRGKLPDYMVPLVWVQLDRFPVTSSGKINKNMLPDPIKTQAQNNEYVAPRNEIEEKLAVIWQELLNVEMVGIYDNFFELGGHSLLAMRMVAYIERSLLVSIPVKALFQFTCINDLSKYLEIHVTSDQLGENKTTFNLFDV